MYDVCQGSADAAIIDGAQIPVNDPTLAISAMAAVTSRLGFGITVSSTYEKPYAFASTFSTLDHLTKGRVGWNIVTSYLDSAARNLGLDLSGCDPDQRLKYVDGFNLAYAITPGTFTDIVDCLVPELRERGRIRTSYPGTTLRESFYGAGQAKLRDHHPGARYRRAAVRQSAGPEGEDTARSGEE